MEPSPEAQREQRRPALSISEAARRTGTSRTTVRRRLDAGELQWAWRTPDGAWRVPVSDLLACGFELSDGPRPSAEPSTDSEADSGRVAQLERDLAVERARREAAERIAAERLDRVEDLRGVLRALEAGERREEPPAADSDTVTARAGGWRSWLRRG